MARCDPQGVLAVPVTTLTRDARTNRDIADLAALVAEYEAVGVVVGLPRTLAGREGASAELARSYGSALAERIAPLPVEYVDERFSSTNWTWPSLRIPNSITSWALRYSQCFVI